MQTSLTSAGGVAKVCAVSSVAAALWRGRGGDCGRLRQEWAGHAKSQSVTKTNKHPLAWTTPMASGQKHPVYDDGLLRVHWA
jgi:hypothetical protein